MFTGIIESLGKVRQMRREGTNVHFTIESDISSELKVDQSLAHNGVCLTVVGLEPGAHIVTAIEETLKRSNLGDLQIGTLINLERAMRSDGRLDGHIVQGHVDTAAICSSVETLEGSWYYHFRFEPSAERLLVDKGCVCVDGVSLTVVSPTMDTFSVAIIPYTYEHTNFQHIQAGTRVNLEFDVIGKYIARYAALYFGKS